MRQDIFEYLCDQGWSFSHETEDGRRIWCQVIDDPYTKTTVARFTEEAYLVELAMEAMG